MTSLIDLYNFIFNYEVQTSFLAFLRFITCGFIVTFYTANLHDFLFFSHPNKIFSGEKYKQFCKLFPQTSLFNFFPNSLFMRNLILAGFWFFGTASALGLFTKFSLLMFIICFFSLQSRVWPIFVTGGDSVSKVLLLSLLFVDCGAKYSIDNLLGIASNLDKVPGLSIRLVQFFLCWGWMASSFFKLKDGNWGTGESVRNVLLSPFWSRGSISYYLEPILSNLKLSKALGLSILIFEFLAFPLFYFKETRLFAIIFALLFHLSIGVFMQIGIFGPMMFVAVFYFTNQFFK